MKKLVTSTLFLFLFLFTILPLAYAQEDETSGLPEVGITPASPLFFFKQAFEGIGTLLTFGDVAKTERRLILAERRLAEANALAKEGDPRADKAIALYEEQVAKAEETADNSSDANARANVADRATRHIAVLDKVIEQIPEEAKDAVRAAKERSIARHIEVLREVAEENPERAAEIFAKAAEGRIKVAEKETLREEDMPQEGVKKDEKTEQIRRAAKAERIDGAIKEYEQYAEFGQEVSSIARELKTDEASVTDLVERAGERHLEILRDVQVRVPEEAKEGIMRAIESAGRVRDLKPITPVSPTTPARLEQEEDESTRPDAVRSKSRALDLDEDREEGGSVKNFPRALSPVQPLPPESTSVLPKRQEGDKGENTEAVRQIPNAPRVTPVLPKVQVLDVKLNNTSEAPAPKPESNIGDTFRSLLAPLSPQGVER